jgi:hypothetical protein
LKRSTAKGARFLQRHQQVVAHALVLEHGGALELAADAGRAIWLSDRRQERDAHLAPTAPALVGPGLAGDDVHEGGLARPVGADDGAQFRQADLERQVVDRLEPVEGDEEETKSPSRSVLIRCLLPDEP